MAISDHLGARPRRCVPRGVYGRDVSGWVRPALPAWWGPGSEPAFVGRLAEFAELEEIWQRTCTGSRQVVFVGGEPGAGKSRLLAEASRAVQATGAAVLVGHCLSDSPVAYQPFRDPIRCLLGAVDLVDDAQARDLVRSRLMSLLGTDDPERDPTLRHAHAGPARDHFDALITVLMAVSAVQPTVVVLEDLHWSTASTQQLISYLVQHLTDARLLLLVSHRPTPPDRSESVVATITDLYRLPGVHRLDLVGLSTADVTAFVGREAGVANERAKPLASQLRDQTGGNPFFLQEVCRDIRADPYLAAGTGSVRVPSSVRDAFATRLSSLDDASRELVELAAVIGERVPLDDLLGAASLPQEVSLQAIEHAVRTGLLVSVPAERDYRFRHALARQAVLDLVPPVQRARLHGRAAVALERRSTGGLTETQQLAHHYRNAVGPDATTRARHYLANAADLTERALAHEEAARYYQAAAELADNPGEQHRLELLAVGCMVSAGMFTPALQISQRVCEQSADPAVRLAAAVGYEQAARHFGGAGAMGLLSDALRDYGADYTDVAYLWGLASLSRAMASVGAPDEGAALHDSTLTRARVVGDGALLAHTLDTGLWSGLHRERLQMTTERAQELSALSKTLRQYHTLGSSGFFRSTIGYVRGDRQEIERGAADMRMASERSGLAYFDFWSATIDYGVRLMRGDFVGAEAAADDVMRISSTWQGAATDGLFGVQVFMLRRETGRLGVVRKLVTGEEDPAALWAPGLLALYTELGMVEPTRRVLSWLLDQTLEEYWRSSVGPAVLGFLVEAALLLQDEAALRWMRPKVAEHSGLNLVSGQFVAMLGSADRYLGCIDSALGEGDPLARFEAAEQLDQRTGSRLHLATTLAARARHLAAHPESGRAGEASEVAARARALAEPVGHQRVLSMLDEVSSVDCPPSPAGRPSTPLTEREMDVMQLLVDGASNHEISQRLVISPHTAANHVRSILAKTNASNRTQAAMTGLAQGWVRRSA